MLDVNTIRVSEIDGLFRKPEVLVIPRGGDKEPFDLNERVMEILMDKAIRRGSGINVDYDTRLRYQEKMAKHIAQEQPIEFVFNAFPFKCHNPFETARRTPDLGEIAFLQRLADINETVRQIYSPGVNFTVLAEGQTFGHLFGANTEEIEKYQRRLKEFSQNMNLGGVVEIVDFMEIVDGTQDFLSRCKKHESEINGDDIRELIPVMMRSLPIMENIKMRDLLAIFGNVSINSLSEKQQDILQNLSDEARQLAIGYLSIQRTKKEYDLIREIYPDHLYVTTLPRVGIYAFHPVHRRTRLFPHHGVPVLGSDRVDIEFLGEIIAHPDIYTAVYCEDDIEDAPFYFLKGKQHIRK